MRRRRRVAIRRRGSSLIEVLLAAGIVAVGFVGVAGALSYAAKASRVAKDMAVAEQVAADVLAQARLVSSTEVTSWYTYAGESNVTGLEKWRKSGGEGGGMDRWA